MENLKNWERELLEAAEAGQVRELPATEDVSPQSGYAPCACRDCMDVTVSSDWTTPELCSDCKDAGCEPGQSESDAYDCQRDDTYEGCAGSISCDGSCTEGE